MEAYPLESLLSLRRFREESAGRRVAAAQNDCRVAEEAVKREEEALERWRVWYAEEVSRRYDGLIGQKTTIEGLEGFLKNLALLASEELEREMSLDEARKQVETSRRTLEETKKAALQARKSCAKMEKHRSLWMEEAKKLEEQAQDRALEEFKPVNRFGAEAPDGA